MHRDGVDYGESSANSDTARLPGQSDGPAVTVAAEVGHANTDGKSPENGVTVANRMSAEKWRGIFTVGPMLILFWGVYRIWEVEWGQSGYANFGSALLLAALTVLGVFGIVGRRLSNGAVRLPSLPIIGSAAVVILAIVLGHWYRHESESDVMTVGLWTMKSNGPAVVQRAGNVEVYAGEGEVIDLPFFLEGEPRPPRVDNGYVYYPTWKGSWLPVIAKTLGYRSTLIWEGSYADWVAAGNRRVAATWKARVAAFFAAILAITALVTAIKSHHTGTWYGRHLVAWSVVTALWLVAMLVRMPKEWMPGYSFYLVFVGVAGVWLAVYIGSLQGQQLAQGAATMHGVVPSPTTQAVVSTLAVGETPRRSPVREALRRRYVTNQRASGAMDPIEAKLTRLDGLKARSVITESEWAEQRAKILASL